MRIKYETILKKQAIKTLADLHHSKEPVLITGHHGQPSAYLVDVEYFESMQRRIHVLEGIARGETAFLENRTLSQEDAMEIMII